MVEEVLPVFLATIRKEKDRSNVERKHVVIAKLDASEAVMVSWLIEEEESGGHRQERYVNVLEILVVPRKTKMTEDIGAFVKPWCRDQVGVDSDELSSN